MLEITQSTYHRHGKAFYKPYRNYFDCGEKLDDAWEVLINAEYAADDGKGCCWLTRDGMDWLGENLGITIYNELI